jgi:hypothetical protein
MPLDDTAAFDSFHEKFTHWWTLDANGEPVPMPETADAPMTHEQRCVGHETITFGTLSCKVSTVFLFLDHSIRFEVADHVPILWETMIFGGGELDQHRERCGGSRADARAMHERVCQYAREELAILAGDRNGIREAAKRRLS